MFWALLLSAHAFARQNEFKLTCKDRATCHDSVGAFVTNKGICTTYLITSDIVGTNRHCLGEEQADEGTACEQTLIYFPANANFETVEKIQCEKVLSVAPHFGDSLVTSDFAFLKLKTPSKRPPIRINRDGVADNKVLKVYKMNPVPGENAGVMDESSCKAVQRSLVNPYFVKDSSPLVYFSPCAIIHGNSGSPLLDENGQVRAMISAIFDTNLPLDATQTAHLSQSTHSMGTGLACLALGFTGLGSGSSTECNVVTHSTDDKKQALSYLLMKVIEPELEIKTQGLYKAIFMKMHEQTQFTVRWRLEFNLHDSREQQNGLLARGSLNPDCLLKPFAKAIEAKLKGKSEYSLSFDRPVYELFASPDDDLRLVGHVDARLERATLRFHPTRILAEGSDDVSLEIGEPGRGPAANVQTLHLKSCK